MHTYIQQKIYKNGLSGIILWNPKLETIQMSTNCRTDKQINGIPYSNMKELHLHTTTWVNLMKIMLSKLKVIKEYILHNGFI